MTPCFSPDEDGIFLLAHKSHHLGVVGEIYRKKSDAVDRSLDEKERVAEKEKEAAAGPSEVPVELMWTRQVH